ncbi:hypothetical protein Dpo_12c00020 [Desulfotignum phosphitoxidans DSM 13687]|uniref:Uncharacterized protein n=1 Tax=Desulfotignum phosphitoxidans DSM 13687 TaxID=1286635 RepID=S0FSS1_9BACT|nr:hypothetical protein Dpo_12c00020 [Desulfotignum phosphitoxidans DSM 13687]
MFITFISVLFSIFEMAKKIQICICSNRQNSSLLQQVLLHKNATIVSISSKAISVKCLDVNQRKSLAVLGKTR